MARVVLLLGLLLLAAPRAGAMAYSVSRETSPSGVAVNVVRMSGLIGGREFGAWRYALSELYPSLDTLFVIDSPGGEIHDGFFLLGRVEELMAAQRAAERKVAVLARHDCSSMCIPLYYFFDRRFAEPDARFGFHGVSLGVLGYGGQETDLYLRKLTDKAAERGDGRLPAWLNEKRRLFLSSELTPVSARELASQGSGLVDAEGLVGGEAEALDRLVR